MRQSSPDFCSLGRSERTPAIRGEGAHLRPNRLFQVK